MEVNSLSNKINKLSTINDIELARLEIYSIVIAMILSKDIFKSNKEIKLFVESMDIEIKDYLLRSRSNIFAKVVREIKKADVQKMNICIDIIQKEYKRYLSSYENVELENKRDIGIDKNVVEDKKNTYSKKPIKHNKNKENYMSELMKKYSR